LPLLKFQPSYYRKDPKSYNTEHPVSNRSSKPVSSVLNRRDTRKDDGSYCVLKLCRLINKTAVEAPLTLV